MVCGGAQAQGTKQICADPSEVEIQSKSFFSCHSKRKVIDLGAEVLSTWQLPQRGQRDAGV